MSDKQAISVIEAIFGRRSIRKFLPEKPKKEDILRIIEAGI